MSPLRLLLAAVAVSLALPAARAEGAGRLIGRYVPSPKNAMVRDHYAKLGFTLLSEEADGGTVWALDLSDYVAPDLPMVVDDTAAAALELQA